jgi:hypothetical protein
VFEEEEQGLQQPLSRFEGLPQTLTPKCRSASFREVF